ncbi:Cbb3-type cytochrome c oxidase subunit CcoN1 [Gammaproteobacteria bacterium]
MTHTQPMYHNKVVRQFAVMAVVWGLVGMAVGVWLAAELAFPTINLNIPWLSFGRLRPLHTHLMIFAFGGCALFATSYHVAQSTGKVCLANQGLANFTFWGWQLISVLALITLPLGMTSGKEYAEAEWPIDVLTTLIWLAYAVVFFKTLARRETLELYVANWFYGAAILAFLVLHLVNNFAIPISFWPMKSYSFYPGAVDALTEGWYSHTLMGLFLTGGFLGTLYYFLPKGIDRPVYSYRLAQSHFWAMIFLIPWIGSQHLLYSALPDWVQSLGMVFALLLLVPFWGGVLNGFLTLSGSWPEVKKNPALHFMAVGLSFYAFSTLEGPLLAVKTINASSHYTDWTVAHAHAGAMGSFFFLIIGALYTLLPSLFRQEKMYSLRLITVHFWLTLVGIMLHLMSLWSSGIMQSRMWYAMTTEGLLRYTFLDSTHAVQGFYWLGTVGGLMSFLGMCLMAYNVRKTAKPCVHSESPKVSHTTHAVHAKHSTTEAHAGH